VAQVLLPLYLLVGLVRLPRWRPALLGGLLLIGAYTAVTLPWLLRNGAVHGSLTLAGGLGEGLAVRTIRLEQEFDFRAPAGRPDPLRDARRLYRQEAEQGSAFELAERLRDEADLSAAEADRAMRDIALGALAQRPAYYLTGSLDMFGRMFAGRTVRLRQDWQPWRGIEWDERVAHLLPVASPLLDSQFALVERLVTLYDPARWWPLLSALFVVGCLAASRQPAGRLALVPAAVALGLLLASALLVGIEWRYRYPLDPLINVTVAGGLVALVGLVSAALARLGPRRQLRRAAGLER
jgi:hypothetical protein